LPIVLLAIAFGIEMLALQWFITFGAIILALAAVVGLVCWIVWIMNNRA
jgi:hypothetical protein